MRQGMVCLVMALRFPPRGSTAVSMIAIITLVFPSGEKMTQRQDVFATYPSRNVYPLVGSLRLGRVGFGLFDFVVKFSA